MIQVLSLQEFDFSLRWAFNFIRLYLHEISILPWVHDHPNGSRNGLLQF